jgi:MspA
MFRCAALLATCVMASALIVPIASADPETEPVVDTAETTPAPPAGALPDGAPPPEPPPVELVESSPPATSKSPDGWTLTVSAKDETQRVIQPLTTAISTREYEVGGLFNAKMEGPDEADSPEGTFEVGYQIGCGIDMSTSNGVVMSGSLGFSPGLGLAGLGTAAITGIPTGIAPISGSLAVALKPGIINVVPVSKKAFKGAEPWIQITGFRVKSDGCVGESFIRSYAFLTRSTDVSDAILGYYGVTKKV